MRDSTPPHGEREECGAVLALTQYPRSIGYPRVPRIPGMSMTTHAPGFSGEYDKRVLPPCMEELTINVMGEKITIWTPEESTSGPHLDEFPHKTIELYPPTVFKELIQMRSRG